MRFGAAWFGSRSCGGDSMHRGEPDGAGAGYSAK